MLQLAAQLIALQIVVLLLIRPLLLWYFRINELRAILLSIDASLKCLPAVKDHARGVARTSPTTISANGRVQTLRP